MVVIKKKIINRLFLNKKKKKKKEKWMRTWRRICNCGTTGHVEWKGSGEKEPTDKRLPKRRSIYRHHGLRKINATGNVQCAMFLGNGLQWQALNCC